MYVKRERCQQSENRIMERMEKSCTEKPLKRASQSDAKMR
jgi:hypothetical protein